MKFMNVFARASKSRDSKAHIHGKVIEGFKDKQESMQELEPLELSVLCGSSEEGENNRVVGSRSLCLYEEDSWQILVVKPIKKEENKPLCEVLSFWKQREKGEA